MGRNTIIELRDTDGSFVRGALVDAYRMRVLRSDFFPRGAILLHPRGVSWESTAIDLGGFTRVLPRDLVSGMDEPIEINAEILDALNANDDVVRSTHEAIERRAMGVPPEPAISPEGPEECEAKKIGAHRSGRVKEKRARRRRRTA